MEELKLIKQAKKGDSSALAILLRENYPFLVKYLIKITLQPQLAEDLAQDTMVKCIEKISLYNGSSKFSSWLITIATNLFIDSTRKQKREKLWSEQEKALRKVQWQLENSNEEWNVAIEALFHLSEELRIPIILKHYYGYSYDEISKLMGIPEGTVKSRIHNGLISIRKELSSDEREAQFN
jgi:RNA polymerase sigma-70 factor (ECF subfamily)